MKNKKPEIRFKGFSEEWEERKLLDNIEKVVDFRGRTPKKMGLDWSEKGYLALSALNVKNGYIDPLVDAHYGNQELYDKWMTGNELHKNQVLFTTEAPMGNVVQIPDDKQYILSQRTIAFKVNYGLITEDFLATILGSPKMFLKLSLLSSGGTAKGVSQKSLATVDLWLSKNIDEQTQIGIFFKNLDNLITLHQQKYEKLGILKKAMLEKMFPKNGKDVPEIRFKGFEGAWEERKLGEICVIGDIDHRMPESVKDGIPYIMTGSFVGINDIDFENSKLISTKDYEQLSKKIKPETGDILFARYASVGAVRYVETQIKFLVSYSCAILKRNDTFNSKYLFYYLQSKETQRQIELDINTGSQRNIGTDSLKKLITLLPSPEEQEKIGNYFKNLDNLLTLHQGELGKLKNLKKAMLGKMFV